MTQIMERPTAAVGEMLRNVTTVDVKTLRKYLDQFERRDDILRGLGIVGWDTYERAVEAFLLVGGSILLVGSHGEGKTMLAKKLGAALGVPMAKYDASKNVWEDIIGFPDPARLMTLENRGKTIGIPRIETPTSIWGKRLVLVDEINRACYDEETETLTENGWKKYWEIEDNEKIACYNQKTFCIEYCVPYKKLVYDVDEELYHIKNTNVDVMVTHDHTMFAKEGRSIDNFRKVKIQNLLYNHFLFMDKARFADDYSLSTKTFTLPGVERGNRYSDLGPTSLPMDRWLEFLGYYISEGGLSVSTLDKGQYFFTLSQNVGEVERKIENVLSDLGFSYSSNIDSVGCRRWSVCGKQITTWLYNNVGYYCDNKRIPREFMSLPSEQLLILFKALMAGDGSWRTDKVGVYCTTSKQLADDFQELAYKIGYRATLSTGYEANGNKKKLYRISVSRQYYEGYSAYSQQITRERYKGKVYCFTTSTGLFVTRRNGKITIQGNTPEMQSKWLEVILDQTLMGEQTGTKWIISAMNPGYAGTNPLDLALVSRYMFFIQAPLGVRMPSEDLMEVLSLENPDETPAFMTWMERRVRKAAPDIPPGVEVSDAYLEVSEETVRRFVEASNKLKAVMIIAADSYVDITTRWGSSVDEYIVSVVKTILNEAKFPTDVRRIRMIKNAILSSIALEGPVRGLNSKSISSLSIQELALQVLYMSYPVVAGIEGPERTQLQAAHLKAQDLLEDRSSPVFKISIETDPVKKLILLFQYEDREPILIYKIIGDALRSDGGFISFCTAYALLAAHREGLPLDTQALTIVSTSISEMLNNMSKKSATVTIKETQDQMMLWDLYKFLRKDTFMESAAAQIAYYQVLDSKISTKVNTASTYNQFASISGLIQNLNKTYNQVLPTLQNTYEQIKRIIPEAQKVSIEEYTEEETEEAWESVEDSGGKEES